MRKNKNRFSSRIVSGLLAVALVLGNFVSPISSTHGVNTRNDNSVSVEANAENKNYLPGTYYDYGTVSLSGSNSSGTWTANSRVSNSNSAVKWSLCDNWSGTVQCNIYSSSSALGGSISADKGMRGIGTAPCYYFAIGTCTESSKDNVPGYKLTWDVYIMRQDQVKAQPTTLDSAKTQWLNAQPSKSSSVVAHNDTTSYGSMPISTFSSVHVKGNSSAYVSGSSNAGYKEQTVEDPGSAGSQTITYSYADNHTGNAWMATPGNNDFSLGSSAGSWALSDTWLSKTVASRYTSGGKTMWKCGWYNSAEVLTVSKTGYQRGRGNGSEWRPKGTQVELKKQVIADTDRTPVGWEDTTIYGAYKDTSKTAAKFGIYTDPACDSDNVAKDASGTALTGITIPKSGGKSKKYYLLNGTYYIKEESCSNYTSPLPMTGTSGEWVASANHGKGAWKIECSNTTANSGKTITVTGKNSLNGADPSVAIYKYYKGKKMPASGVTLKITYYDMIATTDNAAVLTNLQMLNKATINGIGTHNVNAYNAGGTTTAMSRTIDSNLKDDKIDAANAVFPGTQSKWKTIINNRVTGASSELSKTGYILGDSAKNAPRLAKVWYVKTSADGTVVLNSQRSNGFASGTFVKNGSDDLPKDKNGNVSWPAGTYVISEVKGTDAFYMNPGTVLAYKVTIDKNGNSNTTRIDFDQYYDGQKGVRITTDEQKQLYGYTTVQNIDEPIKAVAITLEKVNADIGEVDNKDTADENAKDGDLLSTIKDDTIVYGQLYAIDHKYGNSCCYWPKGIVADANFKYETDISNARPENPVLITLGAANGSGSKADGNLVTDANTIAVVKYKDPETNKTKYEWRTADMAITPGTYRFVETSVAEGLVNEYPGPATAAGKYFEFEVKPDEPNLRKELQVNLSKWTDGWRKDAVNDKLKHGTVTIQKVDEDWDIYEPGVNKFADGRPQGDANLSAEFTIWNGSDDKVYITQTADVMKKDDAVAVDAIVGYMYTDYNGYSSKIYRMPGSTEKPFTFNSKTGVWEKKSNAVEIDLPYGTYYINETKQPVGYLTVDSDFNALHGKNGAEKIVVRQDKTTTDFTYNVNGSFEKDYNAANDTVIRGGIYVEKTDYDVLVASYKHTPEGNGKWDNIGFTIKNQSDWDVWVDLNGNGVIENKEIFAKGETIKSDDNIYANKEYRDYTFTLNHEGTFTSPSRWLPFGTYEMCEMSEEYRENGYHMVPNDVREFKIRQDNTIESANRFEFVEGVRDTSFANPVKRAGIKITKYDKESRGSEAQGDGHMDGGVFAIWNTSGLYDGGVPAYDADKNGYVIVDADGDGTLSDAERKDPVPAYSDEQIDQAIKNGLDPVTFVGVDDNGVTVRPAILITTDTNGVAQTSSIALAFGDYVVREVKAPIGYHIDDNFNMHVIVDENDSITVAESTNSIDKKQEYIIPADYAMHVGKLSDLTSIGGNYTATPIDHNDDRYNADVAEFRSSPYDAVIRGSFILQKVDEDDYLAYKNGELKYNDLYLSSNGKYVIEQQGDTTFANAKFKVVNKSKHPIYTYTYDVNGERVLTKYNSGDVVWTFVTDGNGYYEAPDDLLPYGTYQIIEESPSQGYKLTKQTDIIFTIGRENDGSDSQIDINHERSEDTTENDIVWTVDGYTITKIFGAKYQIINTATGKPVSNKSFDIVNSTTGEYPDDIYVPINTVNGCTSFTKVAPGEKVYSCKTDDKGIFVLRQLPARMQGTDYRCGTEYDITGGITGKLKVTLDEYTARFTCNLTTTTCYDLYPIEEPVIRGGLDVLKIDEDEYNNTGSITSGPQGDARLEGAVFSIYNISDRYTWVTDELHNWRRTYAMTDDGIWQANDEIQPDVVYDPNEEANRVDDKRINEIEHTGMTTHGNTVDSDNGAYTDEVPAFNGATSADVIEKYHQKDDERLFYNEMLELFKNETAVLKITTDSKGYAYTSNDALPYGTYLIMETEPSKGYMLPRCWYRIVEIRQDGQMYTYEMTELTKTPHVDSKYTLEPVIRGDVMVEKWDAELTKALESKPDGEHATDTKSNGESHALNNDAMSGIEFKIYNVSDSYTYLWELTGNRNESLVDTSDSRWNTPMKIVNDPMFNPDTSDWWSQLDSDPSNYVMTITTKWNPSTQSYTAETFLRNPDGTKKDIDDNGDAIRGALPYGTYLIRESKTNTKYEFTDGDAWIFQIREEGQVQTLGIRSGDDLGINKAHIIHFVDQIERNDIWFNKIGDGNSVRMDTMWVIKNEDTGERHVIVTNGGSDDDNNGNGTYESGADVNAHTFHTNANDKFLEYIDANGLLESETDVLTEKEANENGNPNGLPIAITMGSKDKHIVTKNEVQPGQKDPVEVVISDDGLNNNGMGYAEYDAGTWFGWCEFTAASEGTSVNPYILSGDAKEEIVVTDEVTGEKVVYHWAEPDDSLKAFPYGHYTISEVRTDSNMDELGTDYTLQSYSFVINNSNTDLSRWATEQTTHDKEVDLGTITDDKGDVSIETELLDVETESHISCADSEIILDEKINYNVIGALTNVIMDSKYHFETELYVVDKAEDGKYSVPEGATPIATAKSETFKIDTYFGNKTVTYKFDGSELDLKGKTIVSYAYLVKEKEDGTEVIAARHTDANDTEEQVTFPNIESDFIASITGDKDVPVGEDVTLIDTIHASNIFARTKYAVRGVLMTVDEEGNAIPVLDKDGEPIEAISDYKYISEGTEADFSVSFKHVDTTKYEGKKLVAYCYLLVADTEVAKHEDIADERETVYVPRIETDAIDGISGDQQGVCVETGMIIDKITFENLTVGKWYTAKGTLYERLEDGSVVPVVITAEDGTTTVVSGVTQFQPTDRNGTVEVVFDYNSMEYAGKDIVVYEEVFAGREVTDDDENIASDTDATDTDASEDNVDVPFVHLVSHADADDERQTVHYPEITTNANDANTGTKSALAIEEAEIVDTISYKNLIPGNEYYFEGKLMTKDADGNATPVLNDGKEIIVRSEKVVPTEANGSIDVTFKFDATEFVGKDITVFEKLISGKNEDIVYVTHEDINDTEQTVHYPEIGTMATDPTTGDEVGYANEHTTLVDTVEYKNLVPGLTYRVVGIIMDKETGKPVKESVSDNTVTEPENPSDDPATPSEPSVNDEAPVEGTATDATETTNVENTETEVAKPETNVADDIKVIDEIIAKCESLHNGNEDASLEDIENAINEYAKAHSDSIEFSTVVATLATISSAEDKAKAFSDNYETIIASLKAVKNGMVVNNGTTEDEPSSMTPSTVDENGYITSSTTFVAPSADGTVDVSFVFNATGLKGRDVVVFEKLYLVTTSGDEESVNTDEFELANHEDINDEGQTIIYPDVHTEALTENKLHEMKADKEAVIVDTVYCENLVIGKEYTISGTLMNKSTNSPLIDAAGNSVKAEMTFTAEEQNCTKELEFKFDASLLRGETLVVFETLEHNNVPVAVHNDIEDVAQTVYLPDIKTIATSLYSGAKLLDPIDAEMIRDEIKYSNLTVGHKYRISGKLVDKATGEVLVGTDGKELSGQVEFTAEVTDGSVFVEFGNINASTLKGKDVVVFEYLYNIDKEEPVLLVEDDSINNTDETVHVTNPSVTTLLAEAETGNKAIAADDNVKLVDTIVYTDLVPGNEYIIVSTLVDKATGETIKDDAGKETKIESEVLKPEKATAEVKATFEFKGVNLKGKVVVAYNDLYRVIDGERYLVVSEHDLENADQTVTFPEIGTTATDKTNGTHTLTYSTSTVITDRVSYKGLEIGKQYTVTGTPYDKETGKPLEGVKPVSVTFTANAYDGFVDVEITVDTTKLAGKKIVMFESVEYEGKEIAVHADLDDEDQTVTVCKIGTTLTGADKTSKTVDLGENVTLVDTVKFEGLVPGQTYVLTGQIIDKESYKTTTVEVDKKETSNKNNKTTTTKTEDKKTTESDVKKSEDKKAGNPWDDVKIIVPDRIGTFVGNDADAAKTTMSFVSKQFSAVEGTTDLYKMDVTMKVENNEANSESFATYVDAFDKDGNKIGKSMYYYVKAMDEGKALEVGQQFTVELTVPANAATIVFYENKSAQKDKYVDNTEPDTPITEQTTEEPTTEQTTEETTEDTTVEDTTPVKEEKVGSGVIAENSIEFTPTTSNGTVEISFVVNTKELKGHHLVAFETVSDKATNKVIAEHKDINDENQTVVVKTSTDVKTGVQTLAIFFTILSLLALAGFAVYTTKTMRKQRVDGSIEENDMKRHDE